MYGYPGRRGKAQSADLRCARRCYSRERPSICEPPFATPLPLVAHELRRRPRVNRTQPTSEIDDCREKWNSRLERAYFVSRASRTFHECSVQETGHQVGALTTRQFSKVAHILSHAHFPKRHS